MDIDSYIVEHRDQWDRLATLSGRRRLTGEESDELVDLYQRVGTHLSVVRAAAYDPALEAKLSSLLGNARAAINGTSVPMVASIGRFFGAVFPAAVYRNRWLIIATAAASLAVVVLLAFRVINEPGLADSVLSHSEQQQLVDHDFATYYTENPNADFAFGVWVNNARVAAVCISMGIAIVPLLLVLWSNMANLGIIAGFMLLHGRGDVFYGLILPHGLLELTAVFVAAGTGFRLAWAWISPGLRSRGQALAEEGRAGAGVALGLVVVLLVSGVLEGFLTPSTLPAWARITIGALVWAVFVAYVWILGRRAIRAGWTGDLDVSDRSATVPTEAAV